VAALLSLRASRTMPTISTPMLTTRLVFAASCLLLASCQADTLTYATASGADAIEPIYRNQTLANLARSIDEPNSLPSIVYMQTGTMQETSSVTPSLTFPLWAMFASTNGPNASNTKTTAGGAGTIQGSLGIQLNYIVAPPPDTLAFRNLRALYMTAICNSAPTAEACAGLDIIDTYTPSRILVAGELPPGQHRHAPPGNPPPKAPNDLVYDPYFLSPPLCVLCLNSGAALPVKATPDERRLKLHPTNLLTRRWLYWVDAKARPGAPQSGPPPAGLKLQKIGETDGKTFYATSADFAEFMLLTMQLPTSPLRPDSSGITAVPGGRPSSSGARTQFFLPGGSEGNVKAPGPPAQSSPGIIPQ
jgi:hypothetical protein